MSTEKTIISAATNVFFRKGLKGSRMQEIADEAGINKALLHYYFRSKEKLYKKVVTDALDSFILHLNKIMSSEIDLFEKTENLVHFCLQESLENPLLPSLLTQELDQINLKNSLNEKAARKLDQDLKRAANNGAVLYIPVQHYLANLFSLTFFPISAGKFLESYLQMDKNDRESFSRTREKLVVHFISRAIKI